MSTLHIITSGLSFLFLGVYLEWIAEFSQSKSNREVARFTLIILAMIGVSAGITSITMLIIHYLSSL